MLIFWPATVVAGVTEIVGKSVRPHPGIYGIIAFIAAYFFTNALTSTTAAVTLGIGGILVLVAAIIFFVAYAIENTGRKKMRQQQAMPPPPSTSTAPQQFSCAACGAKFNTQAELDQHASSAHQM